MTTFRSFLGKVPMGKLLYTAEEFIAIQIAIKLRGNLSDSVFTSQISALAKGLEHADISLPATRHKAEQQLVCMNQCAKKFVIYCDPCLEIYGMYNKIPRKKDLKCRECKANLSELIAEGRSFFTILSIKKQLEGYLKDKKFLSLLKSSISRQNMSGELHKEIACNGHFDLTFGIDAAQLHNTYGKSILPAVLFINNIPISWQLRYPILAALWTGPTAEKPNRSVFLKHMLAELRTLGTDDPILWRDLEGKSHASLVFLTTVISDAPEKAELLNQKGPGGFSSCPCCKATGETITIEKYPRVFKDNSFRRTTGEKTVGGGPRFPIFVHDEGSNYQWRDSKDRLETALRVAQKKVDTGKEYEEEGIKGLPVVRRLPGPFRETDSHASDFLHLVGEGVFEDIMDVLMGITGTKGQGNTFLVTRRSWEIFDEMLATMTTVSECDRNCKPLRKYKNEWKAYDCYEFLMHNVAQMCSDETILINTQIYECLIHLSNIVYLWHHERITSDVIDQTKEEVKKFIKRFKSLFTEEYMTYKAHVLQHIPDFMRLHGSGTYTDGFNLEKFISCCKKLTTTTRVHANQITRNFLLKHQSPVLQAMETFCEPAKAVLRENEVFNEEFFIKFGDAVRKNHEDQRIPEDKKEVLRDFVMTSLKRDIKEMSVTRVIQMSRNSILLESEHAKHRANTKVDDSFIQVEGFIFGRIVEIFHLPEMDKFIIIMRKYERIHPRMSNGCLIEYPMNQFPYQKPRKDNYFTFLLSKDLLIQKAKVGMTSYCHIYRKVRLFTVRPNFEFRF